MGDGERIAWVDAGRVLAAFFVVLFHVLYEFSPDAALRPVGFMGASLFFILSGYSLASRHPDLESFSLEWLKKRWLRIAIVYYPALTAVFAMFPTQVTDAGLFALLTHFFFIDFLFANTAYAIISPAWFLIPLMALYAAFPLLNRLLRKGWFVLALAFFITSLWRINEGPGIWTSFSPLFFLAEFCFGISFAHGQARQSLISAIIAIVPNPLMIIPYALFALLSRLDLRALAPALSFIGGRSLEIFLFHEAFLKASVGRWSFYGAGIVPTLAVCIGAFALVSFVSGWLGRRFLHH